MKEIWPLRLIYATAFAIFVWVSIGYTLYGIGWWIFQALRRLI